MPSASAVHRIMAASTAAQLVIGGALATILARVPEVALFKGLNVIGLVLDLVGVVLLSDLIVARANRFFAIFDFAYAFMLSALIIMPIGALLVVPIAGIFVDLPSQNVALGLFLPVMAYVGTPLFALDMLADTLRFRFYSTMRTRIQFMGWYLFLSGLLLQMVAALLDLGSGN